MRQLEKKAGGVRQATALISALALLLHIVFMALGAMGTPALDGGAAQAHAHHAASAGQDADDPSDHPGHKPPCCILSVCPGLPGPPADCAMAFLTAAEARPSIFRLGRDFATQPSPLRPPVGARAPPLSA